MQNLIVDEDNSHIIISWDPSSNFGGASPVCGALYYVQYYVDNTLASDSFSSRRTFQIEKKSCSIYTIYVSPSDALGAQVQESKLKIEVIAEFQGK